jgi:hypothetical protein
MQVQKVPPRRAELPSSLAHTKEGAASKRDAPSFSAEFIDFSAGRIFFTEEHLIFDFTSRELTCSTRDEDDSYERHTD